MRAIIAGGRAYRFTAADVRALNQLHVELPISEVLSGGAGRVYLHDRFWGRVEWVPHREDEPFPDLRRVVRGSARGADICGEAWAAWRGIPVRRFLPGWELRNPRTGEVLGKKAGPLRNAEMARHADACILFPGGRGTNSMAKEAALAGLRVIDWRVNN